MKPLVLSSQRSLPPLLERLWVVKLIDGFIETVGKSFGVMSDSKGVDDVVPCVTCAMHACPTWTQDESGNKDKETLLFRPRPFTRGRELGGSESDGN